MSERHTSNIQFKGEVINLPNHVKQNILEGIAFTSRWYQNRSTLTAEQRAAVTDVLHNLKIYCSADPMKEVSIDIAAGTISAKKEITQWCRDHPGRLIKSQSIAIQSNDDKTLHSLLGLADIVSHEVAHRVDFRISSSTWLSYVVRAP